MALEPEPGEKGIGCLAALCHAEKEKEGEVQPSNGKTQEKVDHYWSEAMDKGKFIYDQNIPNRRFNSEQLECLKQMSFQRLIVATSLALLLQPPLILHARYIF